MRRPPGGYQKVALDGQAEADQHVSPTPSSSSPGQSARKSSLRADAPTVAPRHRRRVDRASQRRRKSPLHPAQPPRLTRGISEADRSALRRCCCCWDCACAVRTWSAGLKVTAFSGIVFVGIVSAPVLDLQVRACVGTTALMATWWILRYVPVGITSFVPVVIFPLFGICSAKDIASAYYNDTVLLLIGTCIIALALERTNALSRLAFRALAAMPASSPRLVLLTFMIITAALSVFVANTAAAAVVIPILSQLRAALEDDGRDEDGQPAAAGGRDGGIGYGEKGANENEVAADDAEAGGLAQEDNWTGSDGMVTPADRRAASDATATLHQRCKELERWCRVGDLEDEGHAAMLQAVQRVIGLSAEANRRVHASTDEDVTSAEGGAVPAGTVAVNRARPPPLPEAVVADAAGVQQRERWTQLRRKEYFERAGLGVAFAASMGGMASLTGTGPNVVLAGVASQLAGGAEAGATGTGRDHPGADLGLSGVGLDWGLFFLFGLPLAALVLAFMWACLAFVRFPAGVTIDVAVMRRRLRRLGPMGRAESTTLGLLLLLVALWLLRAPGWLPDGFGWAQLAPDASFVSDATAATAVAVLLFVIPADDASGACSSGGSPGSGGGGGSGGAAGTGGHAAGAAVLDWPYFVARFPHSLVLLIAGGCALSEGFARSGLSEALVDAVAALQGVVSPAVLMLVLMLAGASLSQFASNGAAASILVPLAATLATAEGLDPRMFMVPTALACSLAFLLPISTPPNAIAFEAGLVGQAAMMRWAALFISAGLALIACAVLTLGGPVLGISFARAANGTASSGSANATASPTPSFGDDGSSDNGDDEGAHRLLQLAAQAGLSAETTAAPPPLLGAPTTSTQEVPVVQQHLKDPYYYYSIGASSPQITRSEGTWTDISGIVGATVSAVVVVVFVAVALSCRYGCQRRRDAPTGHLRQYNLVRGGAARAHRQTRQHPHHARVQRQRRPGRAAVYAGVIANDDKEDEREPHGPGGHVDIDLDSSSSSDGCNVDDADGAAEPLSPDPGRQSAVVASATRPVFGVEV